MPPKDPETLEGGDVGMPCWICSQTKVPSVQLWSLGRNVNMKLSNIQFLSLGMTKLTIGQEVRVIGGLKSLWKNFFVCGIPQMPTVKYPAERLLPFTQECHHPLLSISDLAPYFSITLRRDCRSRMGSREF